MTINLYYVGRITLRQKRIDKLIKVLQIFPDQSKTLRLNVFGSGDENLIEDIKSCGNDFIDVRFNGFIRNWTEYVSDDWIQIFFSDYEGCPLSLLEAIKAGKRKMASVDSPGLVQYMSKNCIFENLHQLANALVSNVDLENKSNLSIFYDRDRFMQEVRMMEGVINA